MSSFSMPFSSSSSALCLCQSPFSGKRHHSFPWRFSSQSCSGTPQAPRAIVLPIQLSETGICGGPSAVDHKVWGLVECQQFFYQTSMTLDASQSTVRILADGGKWVCGFERIGKKENSVVYSISIFPPLRMSQLTDSDSQLVIIDESSFEASIHEHALGCPVTGTSSVSNRCAITRGFIVTINSLLSIPSLAQTQLHLPSPLARTSGLTQPAKKTSTVPRITRLPKQILSNTLMKKNGHTFHRHFKD